MAKAAKPKTAAKPRSKKDQYERFRETAHELEIDDEKTAEAFESAFKKIVPARRQRRV